MDLDALYGGSFVNWERVSVSWSKRTIPSRQMLFAARHYLESTETLAPDPERAGLVDQTPLPDEIKQTFAAPPEPDSSETASLWGKFVDAAIAAEMDVLSYGERPPLLHELRNGLEAAAQEAPEEALERWFLARRDALPGHDLPEDPEFLPV